MATSLNLPTSRVLVTAAEGNVGREVVRALLSRGVAVTRGTRTPPPTPDGDEPATETARLDFLDPTSFEPALAACDGLFLLRPPAISNVKATLNRLVNVAVERGVKHVVFLSVVGAATNTLVPHHAVEQHLIAKTPNWTILRPGFFAQNLGDAYRRDILEDDRVYVPAGSGRVTFVHLRDVAEVAALAFLDPLTHGGKAYELTGPAAITFDEVASILSTYLGRSIRYERASLLGYVLHLSRRGLPLAQVLVQTLLHAGLRLGQAKTILPDLERLLGRPALTVGDYVRDNAELWRPPIGAFGSAAN